MSVATSTTTKRTPRRATKAAAPPPEFKDWRRVQAQMAADVRWGRPTDREAAQQTIKAGRLAEHIERVVASAPPLTDEQRTQLAMLLRPTSAK